MRPRRSLFDLDIARADVARVESLLDRSGDLDLTRTEGPTDYFSILHDEAITGFQRRNGLTTDRIVNPDGETIGAPLDAAPAGPRRRAERQQKCAQNGVHLGNLQNAIDKTASEVEKANARVVALSKEAAALNTRHRLGLAITAISGTVPAVRAIRAGLGPAWASSRLCVGLPGPSATTPARSRWRRGPICY